MRDELNEHILPRRCRDLDLLDPLISLWEPDRGQLNMGEPDRER